MQRDQSPSLPNRLLQAAAHAGRATANSLTQDAQQRHDFLMKHGHPPVTSTTPTLIRATIACAILLSATAVLITAMVVYQ